MHASGWAGPALCLLTLVGSGFAQPATVPGKASSDTQSSQSTSPTPTEVGGKTMTQWMTELKNSDPSTRAQAILNLVAFGEAARDAVPLILDRCHDPEASPRVKAVLALKFIAVRDRDKPKVVEALADRLRNDPQTIIRYEAALGLCRFADEARPALPALIQGMTDTGNWELRQACIIAVRRAGIDRTGPDPQPDPRATKALLQSLRDSVSKVRMEATLTLGAMGRPADPQLLSAVTEALQRQLSYKDKTLALWSHVSLLALDDKVTEQSLRAIVKLLDSPERDIRIQVLMALAAIGRKAKTCIPAVLEALEDREPQVVAAACAALPRMAEPTAKVIEGLVKVSKRKEQPLVWAACYALAEIAHGDPVALAALTAVTERKELDDGLLRGVRQLLDEAKKPKK
jgi:HEAT repeat protein